MLEESLEGLFLGVVRGVEKQNGRNIPLVFLPLVYYITHLDIRYRNDYGTMVAEAEAVRVGSAALMAVMVTVLGEGAMAGAV